LLAPFPIPNFLNLDPLFRCDPEPDPALIGRFFSPRGPSLTLPFCHAGPNEFSQIQPADVFMLRLPEAFLLILSAQDPLVRPGQIGLRNSCIACENERC